MIDTTLLVQMLLGALLGLSVYLPLACGQLSLATPGFYAIGGTLAALLSTRVRALGGGESASGSGYPITSLLLEMLLAAVLCGVLANGIGAVVLRLRGIYLTIATIALVEILRVVSLNLTITGGAVGIFAIPQPFDHPAGYAVFTLGLLLLVCWLCQRLAVTRSQDGNPDIYVVDIASGQQTRLTTHEAIDTEAAWAPDGSAIVFTSDRSGGPQIYKVAPTGGEARRVTFNMGNYNSRASYSPDGQSLVMVNGGSGYRIALLDLKTGSSRNLTGSNLDESPSFAPNGSMIIYATMAGRGTELAAVSVDGSIKQRLALQQGEVRDPAWGPLRQ